MLCMRQFPNIVRLDGGMLIVSMEVWVNQSHIREESRYHPIYKTKLKAQHTRSSQYYLKTFEAT